MNARTFSRGGEDSLEANFYYAYTNPLIGFWVNWSQLDCGRDISL